jgi:glycosyltransferase involved in cell wall biosynthesis
VLTKTRFSVAIPAHNEERYVGRCIESILASRQCWIEGFAIVVAPNRYADLTPAMAESLGARRAVEDRKSIAAVRNAAIRGISPAAVATIGSDSRMAARTVTEVRRHVYDPRYVGGGSSIRPERWSLGMVFSLLAVAPDVARRGVSKGMSCFLREDFEKIGGFDEELVCLADLDVDLQLQALGRTRRQKFGTTWGHGIGPSAERSARSVIGAASKIRRLSVDYFTGQDADAAGHLCYNVDRDESRGNSLAGYGRF